MQFKKITPILIMFLIISCQSKVVINEDNRTKTGHLKNNLKQGKWKIYKDKHLLAVGKFSDNKMTGIWKHYHVNGKLHQIGEFKDDKQNGVWKFYYETGEFMGTGALENDKMIGLWKWYHKNASLYTERLYENGKLMNIQSCFDKSNLPQNCGEIIKGNGYLLNHDLYNETDKVEKYEYKEGLYVKAIQ